MMGERFQFEAGNEERREFWNLAKGKRNGL